MLTWGNASGIDRDSGIVAIKPSGVSYEKLRPEDLVLLSLDSGEVVEGELNPSSDTATHLVLYRSFPRIGGVVHTHSTCATSWAQASTPIPCYGTTHADHFYGEIPVTRELTPREIEEAYEEHTGRVIVECFEALGTDPLHLPGVLLPYHGPFTWGRTPAEAATNAIVLEEVARMALQTRTIAPRTSPAPREIVDKHFLRKHGPEAYYGQDPE